MSDMILGRLALPVADIAAFRRAQVRFTLRGGAVKSSIQPELPHPSLGCPGGDFDYTPSLFVL
jgi:hypothetical protein